ncbi:MAG: type II toxin-antitoxin system RelB/DinJ family antitoxin [Oscillospiraceae bacterium]|nr:type II toxin-antitoxin system RelB/DinJ family antitoxin [Oscillospiraceae bacterium]
MTQVNVMIDEHLKQRADILFDELGMSMATAFNVFVRQVVRQGGIPFDITTDVDHFHSASNMRVLRQSIKDANNGKLTEHELIED